MPPSPEATLVILLGASDFPKASQFTAAKAFRNSFERIKSYGLWTLLSNFSAYEFFSGNCIG